MSRMLTTSINQRVKRLVNLDDAEIALLEVMGATNEDDLRYFVFQDFPVEIPLLKRRKLAVLSEYLAKGLMLSSALTMTEIQEGLHNHNAAGSTPAVRTPGAAADADRGAPKVYTDPLPEFSGDAVDYEDWERKAGATIKQTAYKGLLDAAATPGNIIEEARSKELFNMILSCVAGGHALNTVEKVRDDAGGKECGYSAWRALKEWYLDPTQKDRMIAHWETKLNENVLDKDTSATEYINNFEMYV